MADPLICSLDPADIGRSYGAVIRANSQSGKSGAAWLLGWSKIMACNFPPLQQGDFSRCVQQESDSAR
ncbi:hypothetical protein WDV93_10625 [Pantoea ananatis]